MIITSLARKLDSKAVKGCGAEKEGRKGLVMESENVNPFFFGVGWVDRS